MRSFFHATLWHCSHFYCYRSIMINPKFGRLSRLYPPYFPNSPAAKVKQKQLCSKFKPSSEPPWWILGQIGFAPRKLSAWAVSATVRHKKRSSKPIRKRYHYSISLVWGMSWLWLNAYDTILWAMNRHLTAILMWKDVDQGLDLQLQRQPPVQPVSVESSTRQTLARTASPSKAPCAEHHMWKVEPIIGDSSVAARNEDL
jgi:hypothetical protein